LDKNADESRIRTVEALRLEVGAGLREMSEGLFGLRLALPFALDHVNLWLLRDGPSWTLIDTGIANDATREIWSDLLVNGLDGRPVSRLIATHFHPDHMGLAGWLCERTGADFWTTRTEWLMARMLAQDDSPGFVEAGRRFDRLAGLDDEQIAARAARGNLYRTRAMAPPATHVRVRERDLIKIDGERWQVLIGRGHAPEMICLYSDERHLLLAADQVLQRISPNIGVWPAEPHADPLADFIESLDSFRSLPEKTLVLPSHGQAFHGLHARIEQLVSHHHGRLARAEEAAGKGRTAAAIMPSLFDRELDAHQLGFALGETLAHLNYLVARGRLTRAVDPAGRNLYTAA
jgi:glyoxylase-like metal-dependent hydrolase (beta-lactamase superfamily II)